LQLQLLQQQHEGQAATTATEAARRLGGWKKGVAIGWQGGWRNGGLLTIA